MAFDARHDLATYTLADLPERTRHVLLTPAYRWRVVVEHVTEIEHDVILDTVLRIRDAGEKSPSLIADRLQLPADLIQNLLAWSAADRVSVTVDGELRSSESRVAWVYRDLATAELWPDPGAEVPPLPVRFKARFRGRFDRGTAGRPIAVDCMLLDTPETVSPEPTTIELARFSRASADLNRRTAVVSTGERCLVASPVVRLGDAYAVETTRGAPHLSLSQHLAKAADDHEQVARWLDGIPMSRAPLDADLPLRRSVAELRDAASDSERVSRNPAAVLSCVELCLSRFVDQLRYAQGISVDYLPNATDTAILSERLRVEPGAIELLTRSERGTSGRKIASVLLAAPAMDEAILGLVTAAARLAMYARMAQAATEVSKLAESTIELCDRLLTASEATDGQQTE